MNRTPFQSLAIESLENRQMMAGDVTASVVAGDLVMSGDKFANEVAVRATSTAGSYVLEGLNGTKINGQSSTTISNVQRDFRVDLGEGNNVLLLTAEGPQGEQSHLIVPEDLTIDSGSGNDIFVLDNVLVRQSTNVETRGGADGFVTYQSGLAGNVTVDLGDGNDFLGFDTTRIGGTLDAELRDGKDVFLVFDSTLMRDAEVSLGSGDDYVGISGSVFVGDLEVNGNSGHDKFVTFNSEYRDDLDLDSVEISVVAKSESIIANDVGNNPQMLAAVDLIFSVGTGFF